MFGFLSSLRKPKKELEPEDVTTAELHLKSGDLSGLKSQLSPFTREQRRQLFRHVGLRGAVRRSLELDSLALAGYLLKECGAHVDERDEQGLTPLYLATLEGREAAVRFLLSRGASVKEADKGMESRSCCYGPILHAAVATRNVQVVGMILRAGADLLGKDIAGNDCLEAQQSSVPLGIQNLVTWERSVAKSGKVVVEDYQSRLTGVIMALFHKNDFQRVKTLIEKSSHDDKIIYWELMGAALVNKEDMHDAKAAWITAMDLRWENPDSPIRKVEPRDSVASAIGAREPRTPEDMMTLSTSRENMAVQMLLTVERLVPIRNLHITFACACAQVLLETGKGDVPKVVSLLSHTLAKIGTNRLSNSAVFFGAVEKLVVAANGCEGVDVPYGLLLSALDVFLRCLQAANKEGSFGDFSSSARSRHDLPVTDVERRCSQCRSSLALQYHCLFAMAALLDRAGSATSEELRTFDGRTAEFLRSTPRLQGSNVFHHLSVLGEGEVNPRLVEVLVRSSARLHGVVRQVGSPLHLAGDARGRTPLHLMAAHLPKKALVAKEVLDTFLEHGAHLCTKDHQGRSVHHVLDSRGVRWRGRVLPLVCVAALAVKRRENWEERLPPFLNPAVKHFLEDH